MSFCEFLLFFLRGGVCDASLDAMNGCCKGAEANLLRALHELRIALFPRQRDVELLVRVDEQVKCAYVA